MEVVQGVQVGLIRRRDGRLCIHEFQERRCAKRVPALLELKLLFGQSLVSLLELNHLVRHGEVVERLGHCSTQAELLRPAVVLGVFRDVVCLGHLLLPAETRENGDGDRQRYRQGVLREVEGKHTVLRQSLCAYVIRVGEGRAVPHLPR